MMIRYRITLLVLLAFLVFSTQAQDDMKSLKDFVKETDEVFFGHLELYSELSKTLKKEIRDGLVTSENLKPKKIGIVTTYLFEEKFTNSKAHFQYVYAGATEENYFFQKTGTPFVEGIKSAFEGSEIELLSPSQYLDSPEKKEGYSKLAKQLRTGDPFAQTIRDNKLKASGGEFEFIYTLSKDGESGKIVDGLGEYAQELGFDALLSIEIDTKYQSKAVTFNGVQLTLHSLNPDSKKGLLFHRYSLFSDNYYPLAFVKGNKIESEDFAGFKELGERIGKDYLKFIDETVQQAF